MSPKSLFILSLAALAMFGWAVMDAATPRTHSRGGAIALVPEALRVTLSRVSLRVEGTDYIIERAEPGAPWLSVAPVSGPCNQSAVDELESALALLRITRRRAQGTQGSSQQSGLRIDLHFGLGEKMRLDLAEESADARYRWIDIEGSRDAVLVQAYLVNEILDLAPRLRSRSLLSMQVRTSKTLRISLGSRWLQVEAQRLRWTEADGAIAEARANFGEIRELRDALGRLSEGGEGDCVHPAPIRVEAGSEDTLIARDSCVAQDAWNRVWRSFNEPERLANLYLLPSRRPTADFAIHHSGSGAKTTVHIDTADFLALSDWWHRVDGAAIGVAPEQAIETLCTVVGPGWEVAIGRAEAEQQGERPWAWMARVTGVAGLLRLSPKAGHLCDEPSEIFLSKLLIARESPFLRELKVLDGKTTRGWKRQTGSDAWQNLDPQSTLAATRMALALGMLQALAFVGEEPSEGYRSRRRIEVVFSASPGEVAARYQIALAGNAQHCLAKVDALPWASLSQVNCAALWERTVRR